MRWASVAILYVESNHLVASATGRDPMSDHILDGSTPGLRLVIPGICFMEALSWLEGEIKRRKELGHVLMSQIKELRRDLTGETQAIVSHMEQAMVANERLWKVIGNRLQSAIQRLSDRAEILPVTPAVLKASREQILIPESTDNLIARTILDHARSSPDPDKALLTENRRDFDQPEIRAALRAAGILYFASSDRVVEWADSRPGGAGPSVGRGPGD